MSDETWRDRAERAEAQLAALETKVDALLDACHAQFGNPVDGDSVDQARVALGTVLADPAQAAEAYTRRVRDETAAMYRESARIAEEERQRLTVCRRCNDTITPGMMNARDVLHTAEGVECGTCVDDGGYDRRARAEALREAAQCLLDHAEAMAPGDLRTGVDIAAGMLVARADSAERGV